MKGNERDEFLEHVEFIRGIARSLLGDGDSAEDIVQLTWIRSVESPPAPTGSRRSWLAVVASNFARTRRRSEARRERREKAVAKGEHVPPAQWTVERERIVQLIREGVHELEEPYRSTIVLRYYEGLSLPEIARRLDVSLETVRSRLRRAQKKLRARLDQEWLEDSFDWRYGLLPFVFGHASAPSDRGGASSTLKGASTLRRVALFLVPVFVVGLVAIRLALPPSRDGVVDSADHATRVAASSAPVELRLGGRRRALRRLSTASG